MANQTTSNYLNYSIGTTFIKFVIWFLLLFENEDDRVPFSKYYTPTVKIKDCNVVIDSKIFFDVPINSNEET